MLRRSILTLCAATAMAAGTSAYAADAAAGKAKVDAVCGECHVPADWKGTSEADLAKMIGDVKSGAFAHKKKVTLTDADVANIAAYWASAAK